MRIRERLWDLALVFAALGLAAVGLVNLGTAPIWFALAALCLAGIVIGEARMGRALARLPGMRRPTKSDAVERGNRTSPDYPVSMAAEAERQAVLKAVRKRMRKRWKSEEGPVPRAPQSVFPPTVASPERPGEKAHDPD
jgi:hypothetical protein